jgi:hypothetical protein
VSPVTERLDDPRQYWLKVLEGELCGECAQWPGQRVIVTARGLAVINIGSFDRFAEAVLDLHMEEVAAVLDGAPGERLAPFVAVELEGHSLAFAANQLNAVDR